MDSASTNSRVRSLFSKPNPEQDYAPVDTDTNSDNFESDGDDDYLVARPVWIADDPRDELEDGGEPFSWFEYSVFMMLGIAMLWAWNMFLAAAPYFQTRFATNKNLLAHFQSAIISVSCVTNLLCMLILAQMQAKASYTRRIIYSLCINFVIFGLLAISTKSFLDITPVGYMTFTLIMVFCSSVATGLCQNGAFAFAASFGRAEYINAIMTGQAVAGVLPSVAQILSVIALPVAPKMASEEVKKQVTDQGNTTSAFVYFLTALGICCLTMASILPLIKKHNRILQSQMSDSVHSIEDAEQAKRKTVGMWTLYKKLHWLAASVFLCFTASMFFPVFTQKISSVKPEDDQGVWFRAAVFIPLGFLIWNVGDLFGRMVTLVPVFAVRINRVLLFVLAVARIGFLPLYLLCNVGGHGATIPSDWFYLFVVQFWFGATNGWLSSCCMMGAGEYVDDNEREASGGFMAVNLVAGLMVGSLLSFAAANVGT